MSTIKEKSLKGELAVYKRFYRDIKESWDWGGNLEFRQQVKEAFKDLQYGLRDLKKSSKAKGET
jgi:hypothetical protein